MIRFAIEPAEETPDEFLVRAIQESWNLDTLALEIDSDREIGRIARILSGVSPHWEILDSRYEGRAYRRAREAVGEVIVAALEEGMLQDATIEIPPELHPEPDPFTGKVYESIR